MTSTSSSTPWHTYGVLLFGILATSMAAIIIRFAQGENLPSIFIAASRLAIATVILSPITLRRYRSQLQMLSRRDLAMLTVSGLFLALHFVLWISSLEYTTVLVSAVLVSTLPLWSAILEFFFLRSRPKRLVLIGMGTAIIGAVLINLPSGEAAFGKDPLLGSLLALGGAIAVAVYMVIGRSIRPKLDLLPYIWIVYGIAAIAAFLLVFVRQIPVLGYSPQGYLWLLALGIIPQLLGHSSFNYVLKHLSATYVGVVSQFEPVLSATMAFFAFQELPGEWQFAGGAIILASVILATVGQRRPAAKAASAG